MVPLVCIATAYVPSQMTALKPQLNIYWPNLLGGNNGFWTHEWLAHGICSNPPFNQLQYFQNTLNMRTNHDLLAILNAAGHGPTTTPIVRQYSDIVSAIEATTGSKPGLRCNSNARIRRFQLFEIILCFEHSGVNMIDCPRSGGSNCPSQFVFLV